MKPVVIWDESRLEELKSYDYHVISLTETTNINNKIDILPVKLDTITADMYFDVENNVDLSYMFKLSFRNKETNEIIETDFSLIENVDNLNELLNGDDEERIGIDYIWYYAFSSKELADEFCTKFTKKHDFIIYKSSMKEVK